MKGMTVEEKQFTDHESLLLFSALKLNLRYLKNVPLDLPEGQRKGDRQYPCLQRWLQSRQSSAA